MSNNIYHDQENRVPLQARRIKREENVSKQPNFTNKFTFASKRTVLSAININSNNVRVQPSRAAKQGVTYESGIPQFGQNENEISKFTKNSSSALSVVPSFTIHEDSNSSCDVSKLSSTISLPNTSSSLSSFSLLSSTTASSVSTSSSNTNTTNKIKLKDHHLKNIINSPVKNKLKGKLSILGLNKENEDPNKKSIVGRPLAGLASPEDMDVSICDNYSSMVVDSPIVTTEEILRKRDDDFWDVSEYAADIYNYLREAELCHRARANYMHKQTDITNSMRWILVDWLVEVGEEYNLHTETLYLAVSYIDRFLSHMSVKRDKLQLVGTTAMFIAAKYEEIYPPDVGQFAYITDNTYRVSQILRMETLILKVLSFDMAVPTAYLFVNKFAKMCKCSDEILHLALYIAELSMLDCDPFLRYLPSQIAAAAVAIANYNQGKVTWPQKVATEVRYTLDELKECYVNLYKAFCRVGDNQQHAIRDKYRATKWSNVSSITPKEGFPW